VEQFDGLIYPDIGYSYTYPLNLNLNLIWTRESFKIRPTDDECDNMISWYWMLKHYLTMSSGSKARFKNPNCKRDCTKIAMNKIDIKYDDTIVSDYKQCQKSVCLGYVNPQGIAK
jgi:hypothetical protein